MIKYLKLMIKNGNEMTPKFVPLSLRKPDGEFRVSELGQLDGEVQDPRGGHHARLSSGGRCRQVSWFFYTPEAFQWVISSVYYKNHHLGENLSVS